MLLIRLGRLALLAGCTTGTIRAFHRQGLLPLPYTHGTIQNYGEPHLRRLLLLLAFQAAGLSNDEIKARLETEGGVVWCIEQLDRKILQLQTLRAALLEEEGR